MTISNKIIKYITISSLIICTILSVVDFCCFDINFYSKSYKKYNTLETVKTTQEDLDYITKTTLDYLKDNNDDLNIEYHCDGKALPVFEDIELIHMKDVKDLYQSAIIIRNILLIISILGLIYIIFRKQTLKKEFSITIMFFFAILIIIVCRCLIDFDSFWIGFHKIFFTKNDYWLLDPRTCILVNLFNSNFFFDLCFKISLISILILVIYFILVNYYEKKILH